MSGGDLSSIQQRVWSWVQMAFGRDVASNHRERGLRFLEEAVELVQAIGLSERQAHELVAYVYGRQMGETAQEVGGVVVTLAALCAATKVDLAAAAIAEVDRIHQPEVVAKVQRRQAEKRAQGFAVGVDTGGFAVLVRRPPGQWELASRHQTLEAAERKAQGTSGAWVWWGSWAAAEELMLGNNGQGLGG